MAGEYIKDYIHSGEEINFQYDTTSHSTLGHRSPLIEYRITRKTI